MCLPFPHAVSTPKGAYQSATAFWVPHLGTHADQASAKYRRTAHALEPSGSKNTSSDPRCTLNHPVYTPTPVLNSYPSILTISRPFNSLFRVLFTFPSQYLFAIGLGSIFSLGRNLPPIFTQDSQPELLEDNVRSVATVVQCPYGAITLLGAAFPNGLGTPDNHGTHAAHRPQFDNLSAADFQPGLWPLHSPLLGPSLLLSFPALNDMLKFRA